MALETVCTVANFASPSSPASAQSESLEMIEAMGKTIDLEKAGLMLAYLYMNQDDDALHLMLKAA